jgi:hypothetical protein
MHPAFVLEQKLKAYVEHEVSLDELRRWYRATAGSLLSLPVESRPLELATALQLCLIEFDRGDFSERQIRSHLKWAMGTDVEVVVHAEPTLTTSASDTLVTQGLGLASDPGVMTVIGFQLIPTGTTS